MWKMIVWLGVIFLYSSSLSAASIEIRQKRDNDKGNLDGGIVEPTPLIKSLDIGEAANGVTPGTQYEFDLTYRGNSRNSEFQVYAFDDPDNPQVISDRLSIITGVNCCKSNVAKQWNIMKAKDKNNTNGLIYKRFTILDLADGAEKTSLIGIKKSSKADKKNYISVKIIPMEIKKPSKPECPATRRFWKKNQAEQPTSAHIKLIFEPINCVTVIKDYFIQIDFEPWFQVDQIIFNETSLDPMYQITGDTFLRMKENQRVKFMAKTCEWDSLPVMFKIDFLKPYWVCTPPQNIIS